jgi:hypothetical protein
MNDARQIEFLRAQRGTVEERLAELGPEQRLQRINMEGHLEAINEELAALEARAGRLAEATLTFGGRPVVDARAIEASFGSEALQAYQRLVATAAASRGGRRLSPSGPIPDERSARLFITGTMQGSFGFELEEIADDPPPGPSPLRATVEETCRLLQAAQQDDETFADAVSQADPRVTRALADFFEVMDKAGATLHLTAGDRACRFETPDAVHAAAERVKMTEVTEADRPLAGVLVGLLPVGRRFELRLEESGEVIGGRIAAEVEDPAALAAWLGKACVVHARVVTLLRPGKEQRSYVLQRVAVAEAIAPRHGGPSLPES